MSVRATGASRNCVGGTASIRRHERRGTRQLVAGRLDEVEPTIRYARDRAKQADGWVMDTYLLRRR